MITHAEAQQVVKVYTEAMLRHDHPMAQRANGILNKYLNELPPPMRETARYDFSGIVCAVCNKSMREVNHK